MVRRGRSGRGFTLIELLMTSVVAIIMLSAALALFVRGVTQQQEQRRMSEMKRSAALVMGQLTTELRQAGLGRPRGQRVGTGSGLGNVFPASILVAEAHRIGFLTDLPRPDSTFNGFSQIAGDQAIPRPEKGLALLNESNGSCDVVEGTGFCTTDTASQLFDYSTTSAATNCANNPEEARTCPWALNRYKTSEFIIVADSMGRWVERQISPSSLYMNVADPGPPAGIRYVLQLTDVVPEELVSSGANQGYISTPDRVFFQLNNGWWERKQCWGSVGLGSPTLSLHTPCADPTATGTATGTAWERLARVGGTPGPATFTYWKADGTPLPAPVAAADLKSIYRVNIQLELKRPRYPDTGKNLTLNHIVRGSITLRQ